MFGNAAITGKGPRTVAGTEKAPLSTEELAARYDVERIKRLTTVRAATARCATSTSTSTPTRTSSRGIERDVIIEETDVVVIGTGWAGMSTAAYLTKQGVTNYRMLDKAGDFGGTWYWNRYPGCMCDVESYTYLPLLEEVGYMPTKKYAHAQEIFEYAQTARAPLRHVPARAVPDRGHGHGVGRGRQAVDGRHRPRRPAGGPLRRDLRRRAAQGEAAGHPRHRDLPGSRRSTPAAGTTTTPAALPRCRWTSCTTRRSAIIGTGATAVQAVPKLAEAAEAALRVPAHAVVGQPSQPARHRSGVVRRDVLEAGLARGAHGELHRA